MNDDTKETIIRESRELRPCVECAIFNHMQPCEACDNNPEKHRARSRTSRWAVR